MRRKARVLRYWSGLTVIRTVSFARLPHRQDTAGLAWDEKEAGDMVELNVILTDNCQAETFFLSTQELGQKHTAC